MGKNISRPLVTVGILAVIFITLAMVYKNTLTVKEMAQQTTAGPATDVARENESAPAINPLSFDQQGIQGSTTLSYKSSVELDVPFVLEAPGGNWTGPWKDACEESSMAMVEYFYAGKKSVSVTEATHYMQMLFDEEDKLYRSNMNSSSKQLIELIDLYAPSFTASVQTNPTLQSIKDELNTGHPVISLHRGFDLQNKNIAFLASGSSYHVIVVIGYDDATQEFITHDPGDRTEGEGHRYGYELFMKSLHDYNYENYRADGPPRIMVTAPKNS